MNYEYLQTFYFKKNLNIYIEILVNRLHTNGYNDKKYIDMNSSSKDSIIENNYEWNKFCEYLWFENKLNLWLDISKVKIKKNLINDLEINFAKAFEAMDKLEAGEVSNIDENRQVGHYWLRDSSISPDNKIKVEIDNEIQKILNFGKSIINGQIKNKSGDLYTDVLWIGIGGSSLGPMLLVESLKDKSKGLNFKFIDNIDPFLIHETFKELRCKLATTLFVVVSKSGGTPEPRIAMEIVQTNVEREGFEWSNNAIAITMKNSQLYQKASSENWLQIFNLPDWVGGRTSITGSVGLLALALIDQPLLEFLDGASYMDKITRTKEINNNPSALLSLAWFICGNGVGTRDMVVLPYRDRLQLFSKYLQQLIMESLGKRSDRAGKIVHQGISVFGNKGSTDQHAYVQQLRDGIDNFFCIFIEVLDYPKELNFENCDNPKDYLSGFLQGTRSALSSQGRQSITITLNKLNAYTLGSLIALFERAVSLYAELININAYDQPGVEAGKKAAAKVIELKDKLMKLLDSGNKFTFLELSAQFDVKSKETIFFVIRQICFMNDKFFVEGNWSEPETLIIQKR